MPSETAIDDLARGFYVLDDGSYRCLYCGKRFDVGMVYPIEGGLALADRAAKAHVGQEHGGAFAALLGSGEPGPGLTDVQERVLACLYEGKGDREIAAALGGKSESTIRNHRFNLRKRAVEARVFLALMQLLEEEVPLTDKERFIEYPANLPTHDDRSIVTEAEAASIEARCLGTSADGRLAVAFWPKKQKEKLVVLRRIAALFETGRRYSEAETNAVLMPVYSDHVTIRRYLIEYRFLDRVADGSAYWRP